MDRSLQSLPASLQAVTLYEAKGELVDAAGGLLEFSDLLKRPLDAFKYLQLSVETGEVALTAQNVQLNCVMMGSANELHLDAFREHAEFASFRGRLELIARPVPAQLRAGAAHLRHARRARRSGGTWRPTRPRWRRSSPCSRACASPTPTATRARVGAIVSTLTARREGRPLRPRPRARAARRRQRRSSSRSSDRATSGPRATPTPSTRGASARARARCAAALLDAAQSTAFKCLTPLAVLDEIEALCQRKNEFEWLQQDSSSAATTT